VLTTIASWVAVVLAASAVVAFGIGAFIRAGQGGRDDD
jgi:hypothetical protein